MKQLIILTIVVLQGSLAFAQKEKRDIHKGNQLYEQQKYKEAEAFYKKSVDKSKESVVGNFNLADAWYKQKKYEDAVQKFTDIAASAGSKDLKAKAYHNLGNALLESKKLEESIEAYKKSLMNNPKDNETRYNLAYAQEKLKQQQQQDKDDKNKDNKDNKDQNKNDKNNKDQQDKKDQDKNDKDKQDPKDKDQDKNGDQKDDQKGEKPRPDQLSKEDAERMLNALKNEEKNTQEKMKNKKGKAVKGRIVKDW
jgi:tetratricopeptide (TPR) repeat protein